MQPNKFRKGDRVVGTDTSGARHPGVVEVVWRRLDSSVYGVRFDEINRRINNIPEDDLEAEDAVEEDGAGVPEVQ
jgi:hypothetical protein